MWDTSSCSVVLNTMHCLAMQRASSFTVSVFPVPANAGARRQLRAQRRSATQLSERQGSSWVTGLLVGVRRHMVSPTTVSNAAKALNLCFHITAYGTATAQCPSQKNSPPCIAISAACAHTSTMCGFKPLLHAHCQPATPFTEQGPHRLTCWPLTVLKPNPSRSKPPKPHLPAPLGRRQSAGGPR